MYGRMNDEDGGKDYVYTTQWSEKRTDCEDCFDVKEKFQISDECAYYRFNNYKNWLKYQIDKVYERRLMKHFSSKKE